MPDVGDGPDQPTGPGRADTAPIGRTTRLAVGAVAGLLVLSVVAFAFVWAASWSTPPGRYPDTATWVDRVAIPRAGWSLLLGVPFGAAAAVTAGALLGRRHAVR